jgi:tRNA(fMet)-specific endonuclease VapC
MQEAVLLDTDVFSYLTKTGDDRADLYKRHVEGKRIALSFITVGELYEWAHTRRWSIDRIATFESKLTQTVIIPYDVEICKVYATLASLKTPEGAARNIAANDRWIAACALRHDLTFVTHNRKHFHGIPSLRIISETQPVSVAKTGDLLHDARLTSS